VVRSPFPPESLQITWLGDSLGLWIDHPDASARDISNVAVGLFGPGIRPALPERTSRHDFATVDAPISSFEALPVELASIVDLLTSRDAGSTWAPSISWLHFASRAALELAASGRALPAVRAAGLRWRADWVPVRDDHLTDILDTLTEFAPPVTLAAVDKPPIDQVRVLLDHLVDGICRSALAEADWRPPLPRTRCHHCALQTRCGFPGRFGCTRGRLRRMVDPTEHIRKPCRWCTGGDASGAT